MSSSSSQRVPCIDSESFPHILDFIVAHASRQLLLTLRATSRGLQLQCDARLYSHLVLSPATAADWDAEQWDDERDGDVRKPQRMPQIYPQLFARVSAGGELAGPLLPPRCYDRWFTGWGDTLNNVAGYFHARYSMRQASPAEQAERARLAKLIQNVRILDIKGDIGGSGHLRWFAQKTAEVSPPRLEAVRMLCDADGVHDRILCPFPAPLFVAFPTNRACLSDFYRAGSVFIRVPPGFAKIVMHVPLTADARPWPLPYVFDAVRDPSEHHSRSFNHFPDAECYAPRARLPHTKHVVLMFAPCPPFLPGGRGSSQAVPAEQWDSLVGHIAQSLAYGVRVTLVDLATLDRDWFRVSGDTTNELDLQQRLCADVLADLQNNVARYMLLKPPLQESEAVEALKMLTFTSKDEYNATLSENERRLEWVQQ